MLQLATTFALTWNVVGVLPAKAPLDTRAAAEAAARNIFESFTL
jgi:hypothetical protein